MNERVASYDGLAQAIAAERRGRADEALKIASRLAKRGSEDAALCNDLGSLLNRLGQPERAEDQFRRAIALDPDRADYIVNAAIAATRAGRSAKALRLLDEGARKAAHLPKYWTVRANAAHSSGDLAEAERCYEKAARIDPSNVIAAQGRAQVALERGRPEALPLFENASQTDPSNPYVWRGWAEAMALAGELQSALGLARQIAGQAPQWREGLELLAQLKLAVGETDYAAHYREAAARHPNDPAIVFDWIDVLAGLGLHEPAAEVARLGAARFTDMRRFRLLTAVHESNAGNFEKANNYFDQNAGEDEEHLVHQARHRIRRGEHDGAAQALDKVLDRQPWHLSAWALRDIVWRLTEDARHEWLHRQSGLVQFLPLEDFAKLQSHLVPALDALHDKSSLPLGQSLRGGTQTKGQLLQRHEGVFGELRVAIEKTLDHYRNALPVTDIAHPLLRHRDEIWTISGSWSVRLTGGGDHHTAHIHPGGIISSAAYLVLPEGEFGEGALEIGRPPPDLFLDMPPLQTIEPKAGYLALFPSTLYHGTTSFAAGSRMTVAFDVSPVDE